MNDDTPDLESLEERIKRAKGEDHETRATVEKSQGSSQSYAGIRAGFELVGSIAVSVMLGIGLDHWLGTKPIFMLILFFLGVFAGFFNVYRVSQNLGSAVGYSQLHQQEKRAKTAPEQDGKS